MTSRSPTPAARGRRPGRAAGARSWKCSHSSAGARRVRSQLHVFDSEREVAGPGAFLSPDRSEIILRLAGGDERYPVSDLCIVGNHNMENAMAAYLAARAV